LQRSLRANLLTKTFKLSARKKAMHFPWLLAAALAVAAPPPAPAPAAPCSAGSYHVLDFWIGHWQVRDATGGAAGESLVEPVADGCGLLERWNGAPGPQGRRFLGVGLHLFDPKAGLWLQTWTDNRPGVTLMQGTSGAQGFVYTWEIVDPQGKKVAKRYTLEKTAAGVRQLGESSRDSGATWSVDFDLLYTPAR
jgi:hypothetical protein